MNGKFKKEIERILDFYSINLDREDIVKDLSEVVQDAYNEGWKDAKEDSLEEEGIQNGEWGD